MTKAQLRAYRSIRLERDKLAGQIEELEAILYGPKIPNLNGMPHGSGGDNSHIYDRKGDEHMRLVALYDEKVAQLEEQMIEIEAAISPLSPKERTIIRLHYFEGLTWEQVAVEINYTWRHVHRLHGNAISKLQEMEKEK